MAVQVGNLFNSDWGIGITGYASPVPESGNKLFAYFAIAYNGKIVVAKSIKPKKANPFSVQLFYSKEVLKELYMNLNTFE